MVTPRSPSSRHPLQYFTRLGPDNHRITSPVSRDYNCVAWAAGIDDRQIWPTGAEGLMSEPEVTWPDGIRNDESVESIVEFFTTEGYTTCESADFEVGWHKIAIYAKDGYPTHTARQTTSRKWSSKMGFDGVDIEHDDLACLEGNQYGVATTFMRRRVD